MPREPSRGSTTALAKSPLACRLRDANPADFGGERGVARLQSHPSTARLQSRVDLPTRPRGVVAASSNASITSSPKLAPSNICGRANQCRSVRSETLIAKHGVRAWRFRGGCGCHLACHVGPDFGHIPSSAGTLLRQRADGFRLSPHRLQVALAPVGISASRHAPNTARRDFSNNAYRGSARCARLYDFVRRRGTRPVLMRPVLIKQSYRDAGKFLSNTSLDDHLILST